MGGQGRVVRADSVRVARFENLAAIVYEPLQRYLGRRAEPGDAADVLSETLWALWRRLESVPADDPLPWCYGVARRCLANHRRGGRRRRRLGERLQAVDRSVDPAIGDPQLDVERRDPDLARAIESLTRAEQDIVHLWAWERLEPREIAVVLDLTPNAVSVALARAKRKLAQALDPDGSRRKDSARSGQELDGSTVEHGEEQR